MAFRAIAQRFSSKRAPFLSRRAFSTDGKVLSDEERAAENLYIKKIEKEKLEKLKQSAHHEEPAAEASGASSGGSSIPGPSTDSSKNLAVFAGVAALLGVGWLLIRPSSKKDEEKN